MLRRFEAELRLPDGARAPSSMGSILHGALIEQLPEDYADYLHTENLRPYSQSIRWDRARERVIWRIGTLDRTAGEIIGAVLQSLEHIHLRQKGYTVDVQNIQCVEARSYQDIADEYFRAETAPRGAEIHFLTPTSFKRRTTSHRSSPLTSTSHGTRCALRHTPSRDTTSAAFAGRSPFALPAATWCAASSAHSSPMRPTQASASKPPSAWAR